MSSKYERQARRGLATNDRRWRAIRESILSREPLCRECGKHNRITPANEIDHIDGDSHNNAQSNLQPLCKPCHSSKTAGRQITGCDVTGRPIRLQGDVGRHNDVERHFVKLSLC